jgi:hypothetical protein
MTYSRSRNGVVINPQDLLSSVANEEAHHCDEDGEAGCAYRYAEKERAPDEVGRASSEQLRWRRHYGSVRAHGGGVGRDPTVVA